jgi:DNA repair protein RecO (recombination protein O)
VSAGRTRTYRADALVIRRRHLGEADSIFVLYSDDEGKFEAVAKGVRKVRSRKGGHLEPLSRVEVLVAQGRSLDIITQAQVVEPFSRIRDDLDRLYAGLYIAELVDSVTPGGGAQRGLFAAALSALAGLDNGLSPGHVSRWFELRVLTLLGHDLQVGGCASCARPLPAEPAFLAPAMGGLVCRLCRPGAGSGLELSLRAMKVARFGQTAALPEFAAVRIDAELQSELARALGLVVRHVVERDLRTSRLAAPAKTARLAAT